MFGVVLWSDQIRKRAVIWCEDHGDLAFFNGEGPTDPKLAEMEPGDLVQFDVRADRNMRLASKPRLVSSDEYPTLARDLKQARQHPHPDLSGQGGKTDPKIVVFDPKPAKPAPSPEKVRRVI